MRFPVFLRILLVLGFFPSLVRSQEPDISPEQLDFFETHVRPALIKYCYECHSVEGGESRGGLYLDTREGMIDGGSTGPLFEGEYPLFIDAITWADSDFEMPPKQKMPEEVIENLVQWVEMGAPDPRKREVAHVETEIDIEAGKNHWAYQKPKAPPEKTIDEIVAKKREADGLEPVGPADALTLLRRMRFDLTGLPPTPPEVKEFSKQYRQNPEVAYEAMVDDLLRLEQFGERWGRHWLDVVRYGESSGTLNIIYPYAWRFRNYVIDSFNEDKPYDQLLTEHLAGDLLPAVNEEERQEQLIATAFLAVGPKKQNEKNRQVFEMNLIDEQIDTTTRGFLATTVACARCHDHKFDPIPTTDYYAVAGIFKSTDTLWGTVAGNQNHRTSDLLELPIADAGMGTTSQKNEFEEKTRQLAELRAKNREMRGRTGGKGGKGKGGKGRMSDKDRDAMMKEKNIEQRDLVRIRQNIMRLESELEFLNPDGSARTFAMGARDGEVSDCQVLVSGDINRPAQEVDRGFPQVLAFDGMPEIPADESGRLELAHWIASKENPLTARVMVNRIWMHLTGAPIVGTMDNFGTTGLPPSNPELLDYLAVQFMQNGWSVKQLIREIMLSDTYRLASTFSEENYNVDPDNQTYWRANSRQLDAEALRDQMLFVSGLLDRTGSGKSMAYEVGNSRISESGRRDSSAAFNTAEFRGRSVYLPILRDALPDELGLFDFPDPQGTVGQRSPTNVAPQSLHLMNSDLVQRQARAMAGVLERNFSDVREQVFNAYLLGYSRPAEEAELARGMQFLEEFDPGEPPAATPGPGSETPAVGKGKGKNKGKGKGKGKGGKRKGSMPVAEENAEADEPLTEHRIKLAAFCQALMMSAEFRMIH